MWIPPGYTECTDPDCDATLLTMDRGHAHLAGDERWLISRAEPCGHLGLRPAGTGVPADTDDT